MNLRIAAKAGMIFVAIALVLYGVSANINAALGWSNSILNDAWKLIAIALGCAIAAGFAYPPLRGVRRGDSLLTFVQRSQSTPIGVISFSEPVFVTALENGRVGKKIRIRLPNGAFAEGVIESYAGTISPPVIRLSEAESTEVKFVEQRR